MSMRRNSQIALLGLSLSAISLGLPALAQAPAGAPSPPPRSVTLGEAQKGPLPFSVNVIGTVLPVASVAIRTRVDAQIEKILVEDGASVKAGDVLIKLDSRAVEAQLKQAQAQLDKDKAINEQAQRDVARYAELIKKQSTTQLNYVNARTALASSKAAMAGDEAAIENLKVQLSYYTLTAPISGRVGAVSLKVGNIARSGDNAATGTLVTVNQISPIYVTFSVPQRLLPDMRAALKTKTAIASAKPQGLTTASKGQLALLDNAIDPNTGTLMARALFENADENLWPGQLVDMRITLRTDESVISVPRQAVQSGQKGNFVFIVENGVARMRPITVARDQDDRSVIATGLTGTETLVLDGANLLSDGNKVENRAAPPKKGDI